MSYSLLCVSTLEYGLTPDSFHDGQAYTPYYPTDVNMGYYPPTTQSLPHPMAVTSLLDTSLPETVISEEKSQAIVDVIRERFNGSERTLAAQKETLLEGDRSDETHLLSRRMMQTYIGSYWYHFSDQLPIRTLARLAYSSTTLTNSSPQTYLCARQNSDSSLDGHDSHRGIQPRQNAWSPIDRGVLQIVQFPGLAFTLRNLRRRCLSSPSSTVGVPSAPAARNVRENVLYTGAARVVSHSPLHNHHPHAPRKLSHRPLCPRLPAQRQRRQRHSQLPAVLRIWRKHTR